MRKPALYALMGLCAIVIAVIAIGIFGELFEPQNDYCEFAEEYAIAVDGARTSREITDASVEFVSKVGSSATQPIPTEIRGSAENLIGEARSVATGATPDLIGEKRNEILRSARRMLQDCGMEPVVRENVGEVIAKSQPS